MDHHLIRLSKFVSLVLRHKPESVGLTVDELGWVQVDALLAAAKQANVPLTLETLQQVVAQNDKQRFAFSQDQRAIRANHGHSIAVELSLTPLTPPEQLYHGTAARFVDSIQQQGLLPQGRQYVHLSSNEAMARQVGRRHGKPVILTVQAERMNRDGFDFYCSASNIWLTQRVPISYIIIL